MYRFDFEDQLKDVIERVQRDKRRSRENAEWAAYLLRKKGKSYSQTGSSDNNSLRKEVEVPNPPISHQLSFEVLKEEKSVNLQDNLKYSEIKCSRDDSRIHQIKDVEEIRLLLQKIRCLRHNISRTLNSILLQNEKDVQSEYLFKGIPKRVKEAESKRKLMNYQCRILRLDYQLVTDMRELSQNSAVDDIAIILRVLSKCHATASKLLQVFVLGWCDILEMDKNREKFCDLLKSMITITRVCKFLRFDLSKVIDMDDLAIEVINKRCKAVLQLMNKRPSLEKYGMNMKEVTELSKNKCLCKKHQACEYKNLETVDTDKDTVYIPMKRFKKIAKQFFGARGNSGKSTEKTVPISPKDNKSRKSINSSTKKREPVEEAQHQCVIHEITKKKCMTSSIKCNEKNKCDSLGIQDSQSLECGIKDFDVESFSKKLYTALETEIHNNIKCIFRNMSMSQLQIYQTAGQKDETHTFYHGNQFNFLRKLKESFHVTEVEEIPLENDNDRSLQGKREVVELNDESPKQNEDSVVSTNEEEETKIKIDHCLQLTAAYNNSDHDILKPYKISMEKSSCSDSSSLELLPENGEKDVFASLQENSAVSSGLAVKPWDVIGSISEKLIAECLHSISNELDNYIIQNIFDLEFH